MIFKGTTIGMAPLEGMCSHENSGGINVVRQQRDIFFFGLYHCTIPMMCVCMCVNIDVCGTDAQEINITQTAD